MLQAYADESGGKGQGTLFVFSALLAPAAIWTKITDQWQAVLKKPPSIEYFKMAEAASCSEQFRRFSPIERDKKLEDLCRIINTNEITEFCCILILKDFSERWAPRLGRPACEPYFVPFHIINITVGWELLRRGETQPAEVFFDENVIFGPKAKAWYPVIRATASPEVRALMPVEPLFRSDKDILPLQAADLTAWIRRTKNSDGLGEFEWLDSALDLMQHSPLGGQIDSAYIERMLAHQYSREEQEQHHEVISAYRETFGFDWPPQTKNERKRHRGK